MHPILISFGPITIYNFSVFLILAWAVFSFQFFRALRSQGIDEDHIFDSTFTATLIAFVCSRLVYVVFHWEFFADTWLKIVAIWIEPGLSLYGALAGAIAVLVFMSRQWKLRVGLVLDAFAQAFPLALFVGLIGAFLDGSLVGTESGVPWALRVVGQVGLRHPVALYQMFSQILVLVFVLWYAKVSNRKKLPYGMVGIAMFLLWSVCMFMVEFTRVSHVYWITLSANQWFLIAIFAESLGAFYVRGGGKEFIGGLYAKLSKRRT